MMLVVNINDFEIRLRALHQQEVYEGLLEGLPTREQNEESIKHYLSQARELFKGCPTALLEPTQKPIEYDGKYPFGEPASLPSIVCFGRFTSQALKTKNPELYSELVIIWFQDEFAPPINETVLEQFQTLDWRRR